MGPATADGVGFLAETYVIYMETCASTIGTTVLPFKGCESWTDSFLGNILVCGCAGPSLIFKSSINCGGEQ